jgi:hypothetical protein
MLCCQASQSESIYCAPLGRLQGPENRHHVLQFLPTLFINYIKLQATQSYMFLACQLLGHAVLSSVTIREHLLCSPGPSRGA